MMTRRPELRRPRIEGIERREVDGENAWRDLHGFRETNFVPAWRFPDRRSAEASA